MRPKVYCRLLLVGAVLFRADVAMACATCFGAEGDPQTKGLNMAIITLLSVTYTLFFGMAIAAFVMWKRNLPNTDQPSELFVSSSPEEASEAHG